MSETIYRKVGRKYVPVLDWERYDYDQMKVGTWRMTYCYSKGGKRYSYDVRPDTASFLAACELAKVEMERAMTAMLVSAPSHPTEFTKKQLEIIERFRKEMADAGGMLPTWWRENAIHEISEAGIKAVREWKE